MLAPTLKMMLVAICCSGINAQAAPYIGVDLAGNLHVNSSSSTQVFINGVNHLALVGRVEWLERMVTQLLATTAPTRQPSTSGPTTRPTPGPTTTAPSTVPPSRSPTTSFLINRVFGEQVSMQHNGQRHTVYRFRETQNNASVRAFVVRGGSRRAEVLIVGGGGSGGDGNAPGGGGGGGIVALGNVTLVPGTYYVTVGAGGWWDPASGYYNQAYDKPGFCGMPSILRTEELPLMVAHGGAGGNGYEGPYLCSDRTRTQSTENEGGGGGSGPTNNCQNNHFDQTGQQPVRSNFPMDWRDDAITAWDPSSQAVGRWGGSINMSYFYHNGAAWTNRYGGGGGGAGSAANGKVGGAGKMINFDGAGTVYYGAGGGGAGGGGAGGTNSGGDGGMSGNSGAHGFPHTGSGGGGRHDGDYTVGRGGSGIIMVRFVE